MYLLCKEKELNQFKFVPTSVHTQLDRHPRFGYR